MKKIQPKGLAKLNQFIENHMEKYDLIAFEELFGYSADSGKGRPTNSEYIARIADKVRLDVRAM